MRVKFIFFHIILAVLFYDKTSAANMPAQRVLFIVDGSGSMKEQWKGDSKWNIAKETLIHLIDSLSRRNGHVEFAIRILGHQFPREQEVCTDSKLEIPFAQTPNLEFIKERLESVHPQGHTPIAFSLQEAARDFPEDKDAINTILLITDGFETCKGDPCAVAQELKKKRIAINPYIIGLGVDPKYHENFKCVGTFVDATDKISFQQIVRKIVVQSISKTSCQILLVDKNKQLIEEAIPYTIYDQFTGNIICNYINTVKSNHTTDTLYLNPQGIYQIQVHTTPSLIKKDVQWQVGKHMVLQIVLPEGKYSVITPNKHIETLVRYGEEAIQVQSSNQEEKYIESKNYAADILSNPSQLNMPIEIKSSDVTTNHLALYGGLNLSFESEGVFTIIDGTGNRVLGMDYKKEKKRMELLPGKYTLVYRLNRVKSSMKTMSIDFEIKSGQEKALTVL